MTERARFSVDIGGTFTDLVLLRGDGIGHSCKVSSTPAAPEDAVITGLNEILGQGGITAPQLGNVLHRTTVGSSI